MLGPFLIGLGALCMGFAIVMLAGWVSGKSNWLDFHVYWRKRDGDGRNAVFDPIFYFLVLVIAPLLGGAILIAYGLYRVH